MKRDDVVQFNEDHKWCGSLGIIHGVKQCEDNVRYMVGVPIPQKGTAYIFAMASDLEYIGKAVLVESNSEVEE